MVHWFIHSFCRGIALLLSANSWMLDEVLQILETLQSLHLTKMELRLAFYEILFWIHRVWVFVCLFVCLTSRLHHSPDLNWKELSHVAQNLFGENREAHTVSEFLLLLFIFIYLSIWLGWIFIAAYGIFSYSLQDLVPWPGLEPGPLALGTQSVSHWTTGEVLQHFILTFLKTDLHAALHQGVLTFHNVLTSDFCKKKFRNLWYDSSDRYLYLRLSEQKKNHWSVSIIL